MPRTAHPESEPLPSRRDASNPKASLPALIDALIDIDMAYEREREALAKAPWALLQSHRA